MGVHRLFIIDQNVWSETLTKKKKNGIVSDASIVFDMLTLGKENSSRTMIVLTPHNIDIGKENLDLDRIDSFDPHKTLTLVKKT